MKKQDYKKSFRGLLEKRLMDFGASVGPEDPRFQYHLEYEMRAVERGKRIVDALKGHANLKGASLLDLGCGLGGIAVAFAQEGAKVVGVDHDEKSCELGLVRSRMEETPVDFLVSDGTMTPFPDSSFDIVICNDVFEHVLNKKKLAYEINRLLRADGVAFIRTPNKLSPWNILRDDHTGLPFITLLPRNVQNLFVKVMGLTNKGLPYTLKPPTYASLIKISASENLELNDQMMLDEIRDAMYLSRTDVLQASRSNLYPQLTNMLLRMVRFSHDICKLIGFSSLWWLMIKLISPTLTFIARKAGSTDRSEEELVEESLS